MKRRARYSASPRWASIELVAERRVARLGELVELARGAPSRSLGVEGHRLSRPVRRLHQPERGSSRLARTARARRRRRRGSARRARRASGVGDRRRRTCPAPSTSRPSAPNEVAQLDRCRPGPWCRRARSTARRSRCRRSSTSSKVKPSRLASPAAVTRASRRNSGVAGTASRTSSRWAVGHRPPSCRSSVRLSSTTTATRRRRLRVGPDWGTVVQQSAAMNVVVCVKQIPDPATPGPAGPEHQHARPRGQAHPRRLRRLRRRDGAAAGRQGRRRRGHPRVDGAEQRGERACAPRLAMGAAKAILVSDDSPEGLRRAGDGQGPGRRHQAGRTPTWCSPPPSRPTATRAPRRCRSPSCSACRRSPSPSTSRSTDGTVQGRAPDRGRLRRGRVPAAAPSSP